MKKFILIICSFIMVMVIAVGCGNSSKTQKGGITVEEESNISTIPKGMNKDIYDKGHEIIEVCKKRLAGDIDTSEAYEKLHDLTIETMSFCEGLTESELDEIAKYAFSEEGENRLPGNKSAMEYSIKNINAKIVFYAYMVVRDVCEEDEYNLQDDVERMQRILK